MRRDPDVNSDGRRDRDVIADSIPGSMGEIRTVEAGPKNVPHTVTRVEVRNGYVSFTGPTLPGQPHIYEADLTPHQGDINAAIRAALEERLGGPGGASYMQPQA